MTDEPYRRAVGEGLRPARSRPAPAITSSPPEKPARLDREVDAAAGEQAAWNQTCVGAAARSLPGGCCFRETMLNARNGRYSGSTGAAAILNQSPRLSCRRR